MSTKAIVRTGTGGTAAAARTQIGANITLPAGGPFIIFGLYGQVAMKTATTNEGTGGILEVNSVAGDLEPNPAPAKFPLIGSPLLDDSNAGITALPLNIWPVRWNAPGKSQLQLLYTNDQAITTASQLVAGILFGEEIPVPINSPFCDSVQGAFASATEQTLGTITLSENASRITGILCDLNKVDVLVPGEVVAATVRLNSDSMKLQPAEFPCNRIFNSSDGTSAGGTATPMSDIIPLDIPVVGGAIIDVFATSTISVSNNASVRVFLFYE